MGLEWPTKSVIPDQDKSNRFQPEQSDAGVAFAILTDIMGHMPCLSQGINAHLVSLHLRLREKNSRPVPLYPPSASSTRVPTSKSAANASVPSTNTNDYDVPSNINLTTTNTNDLDSVPNCNHNLTSHIGLVGDLRIHRADWRTRAKAPTCTNSDFTTLSAPVYSFTHFMGLLGHMRITENGIHHDAVTSTTSCEPITSTPRSATRSTSNTTPRRLSTF
ncbi:unnamed protein product [Schistocephalus solidus]|uniref:Uncharacterized protein n=1 Tax=Schistocephalus solidus TaxID=70667 RepID=A0A183SEM5_SCHSO|nr:unnamed protein product [Schistocephalus solidus]